MVEDPRNPIPQTGKRPNSIAASFFKVLKGFSSAVPMLVGVILLMGLFQVFVTQEMIASVFTGQMLRDTFIGTVIGSISAGHPITSSVIGGELLKRGVDLFAVTAFIVAWVTVGVIQYPAEASFLGRRFAALRNLLSFLLAILVAMATVTTLMVIL
jgi:uncharacterized membrane protein YraQ (UPF0718 family)